MISGDPEKREDIETELNDPPHGVDASGLPRWAAGEDEDDMDMGDLESFGIG